MLKLTALSALGAPLSALTQETPRHLKVTAAPATFGDTFREVIQLFERAYPNITIDLRVTAREYDDLMQATLREAFTDDLPDLSFQGINQIRLLAERGIAQPLDSFSSRLELTTLYGKEIGNVAGRTMAIPVALSTPVLFLNLDLIGRLNSRFEQAFATWTGVVDLAKRLSSAFPDCLGGFFQYTSGGNWLFQALVTSFGGDMASFERPEFEKNWGPILQALAVLRDFGKSGQSKLDMSQGQARQAFSAGAIGVLVDSSSATSFIQRQIGDRFRFAVMPFPVAPHVGRIPPAGFVAVMFSKNPQQQDGAIKLMRFFVGVSAQKVLATRTGYTPVNPAVFDNPAVAELYRDPTRAVPFQQLQHLAEWHAFSGINSFKITAVIRDVLSSVVTLQISPGEALPQMRYMIEALLSE